MMFRMVAGERPWEFSFESVREPTGSPVVMKRCTVCSKISRLRLSITAESMVRIVVDLRAAGKNSGLCSIGG
jgi:hypothetical protein